MNGQPQRKFAVVSGVAADGHTPSSSTHPNSPEVTLHNTYEQAVHTAKSRLGRRNSYNHMVVYEAVTEVRRTAPPIEVIDLETGELTEVDRS